MEDRVQSLFELVSSRSLGCDFSKSYSLGRRRRSDHRRIRYSSPPGCCGRKRGVITNALGRSRGGFSTKVHALVDTKGRPLHVELTQGQQHESTVAEAIIANHARGKAFIADTGYDSDAIRAQLKALHIKPVICANPTRKRKPRLDRRRYAKRYRVEVFSMTSNVSTPSPPDSRRLHATTWLSCTWPARYCGYKICSEAGDPLGTAPSPDRMAEYSSR